MSGEMLHNLILPLEGIVVVAWGGDTKAQNHHHEHPVQKYAFDLVGVSAPSGQRWTNNSDANEHYAIFGRAVLSPLDGVVVEAVDGIRDNTPGQVNERMVSGNYVLIRHADAVFSHLSHLKQGDVAVKAGTVVRQGQMIGRCGNSGRSTEPHLHFHIQSDDRTGVPVALKCWFKRVRVGNVVKDDYSPVRGDMVQNMP